MAYHQFTIERASKEFKLTVDDVVDLFAKVEPLQIGDALESLLRECVPLAMGIATEKARSELIVTPTVGGGKPRRRSPGIRDRSTGKNPRKLASLRGRADMTITPRKPYDSQWHLDGENRPFSASHSQGNLS